MKYLILLTLSINIHAATLRDFIVNGKKVSAKRDVKEIILGSESRVDSIELNNGEIIYQSEIDSIVIEAERGTSEAVEVDTVKIQDSTTAKVLVGGDGSGGG